MNQSEQNSAENISPSSPRLTRFFLLLTILLLINIGVIIQSTIHSWLRDKSEQIAQIADSIDKRIETYRYATWQLYNDVTVSPLPADQRLQETRLRQDVYYLEKPRVKTEALIFGSHDSSTLGMSQQISTYLDTLWGAESSPWSMYYLNGLDNSMILVSTLPLTDLSSGFRDVGVANIVDARRAEMLQQANTLDERESFSPLRKLNWQNLYYFTLRTTFNMPGHLPTVVAFDLPVNNLIPPQLPMPLFRLDSDESSSREDSNPKEDNNQVSITFSHGQTEIIAPVQSTPLRLVWQVPYGLLLMESLNNVFFPLLLNIILLILAVFGFRTFRHQRVHALVHHDVRDQQSARQAIHNEIINRLPLGVLAYDTTTGRTVLTNAISEALMPHLNLQNITSMAQQRQGIIQATVNNELYEIQLVTSQTASDIQIFMIRNQDKEILVSKKMREAERLYEQNQHARRDFMQHIRSDLQQPAKAILTLAETLPPVQRPAVTQASMAIIQRVDEIMLLNDLENEQWKTETRAFSLTALLDDILQTQLPAIQRKGLRFLLKNSLNPSENYSGDPDALRKILSLLLHYSVTVTQFGKITLEVTQNGRENAPILNFSLMDTSVGLLTTETENMLFPFLHDTAEDRYGKASGMTFFLCKQLAARLGGSFTLKRTEDIGTRYDLHLPFPALPEDDRPEEKLLDDVIVMLDITSVEIRRIAENVLMHLGAECMIADERTAGHKYDLFVTDNPSNLTVSGLLLSDDETGITQIAFGQYRVNFNLNGAMQEAILQLMEAQFSGAPPTSGNAIEEVRNQLQKSGYYTLFIETVPDDIRLLHAESATSDYDALSQTAHRLKGVFAMLDIHEGKHLCELLEQKIQQRSPEIQQNINDIDTYVKCLLQQGSLLHE